GLPAGGALAGDGAAGGGGSWRAAPTDGVYVYRLYLLAGWAMRQLLESQSSLWGESCYQVVPRL
ncbi:hypothetical protein, partial [Thermogutta sp.]|uniref:hypothetical protein n=1 Tax=Thermogutta sp. TaxID=1962930 RepID=UPI0032207C3D